MENISEPSKFIVIDDKVIKDGSAYIIAEMACAHDGDYSNAVKLIDIAKNSGCDAVQLQFFNAKENVIKKHKLYSLLEDIQFSEEQWELLVKYAKNSDIQVFACTYDLPSLELAVALKVDGIKLNSADLTNIEMLEIAGTSGIPFTLGTGASRMDEIGLAINSVINTGAADVILMHGMQNFPTKIENANISRIKTLKTAFNTLVGYADHTSADNPFTLDIDLLALSMGACVFEKHYTIDRSLKGTDYQAALDPGELKKYVQNIHLALLALGNNKLIGPFDDDELQYRQFQKKIIVAASDLKKGHIIERRDIKLLRSDDHGGLDASCLRNLIGKKIINNIKYQDMIREKDIE